MPAPLPSTRTSRGLTTTASAIAGSVTAIRVMSKSVFSTVERPAVSDTRSGGASWTPRGALRQDTLKGCDHDDRDHVNATCNYSTVHFTTSCAALCSANGFDGIDRSARLPARRRLGLRTRRTPLTTFVTGGGSGAPMSEAMRVPLVMVGSVSSGLRSVSMIDPSVDASAMRSASSGMTSSVTTVVGTGLPSFACSWSYLVPAVSTWTLLTTTRESCRACFAMVTTTSTRVPGTTNPATPMTSLTLTEIARMPAVMVGGSPAPASRGASFVSVSGSFSTTGDDQAAVDDLFDRACSRRGQGCSTARRPA